MKIKRKIAPIIVAMLIVAATFVNVYMVKAENNTVRDNVFGWTKVSNLESENSTVTADEKLDKVARIAQTTKMNPADRNTIDAYANVYGYDISKSIEFDIYLNQFPYESVNTSNPAATDCWLGLFLMNSYSENFYTIQAANNTLNFNLRGYSNNGVKHWEGQYNLPNGKTMPWNTQKIECGEDNKTTIKIDVLENKTVIYRKTSGEYVEWFFIPEIGKSFFTEGKLYFNFRFHAAGSNPELYDIGLSEVRNSDAVSEEGVSDYIAENMTVKNNEDQTISLTNGAASSTMYYRIPVDISKKVEISFTIDNVPGYHDDGMDTWLGIFLASSPRAWNYNESGTFGTLIRPKNATEVGGEVTGGEFAPVAGSEENIHKLTFEAQRSKMKISLNGQVHTADLAQNFFTDNKGYIAFRVHNPSYEADKGYNITYKIDNSETIVMPQLVASLSNNGSYDLSSLQSYEITFSGDAVKSLSGNSITEKDYTLDNNKITINSDFMALLTGLKTADFTATGEQSTCAITITITGDIVQITTNGRYFNFDKFTNQDLQMVVKGDAFVGISGNSLKSVEYVYAENTLTIKKEFLSQLRNGEYKFEIKGSESRLEITINVHGQSELPVQIVIDIDSVTFDNDNAADITINVNIGAVTNLIGNAISIHDFTLNERAIIISRQYLENLENGEYSFRVYGEDNLYDEFKLTVINKKAVVDEVPEEEEKDGCGASAYGSVSILVTIIFAAGMVVARKRNCK